MNYTPENITSLEPHQVFVFGSNLAGIHGAGAAKVALEKFGAKCGVGYGLVGQSYGIPTKDTKIQTLPLSSIKNFVENFIRDAREWPRIEFLVTPIGCGLAGYKPEQIAPMFADAPANVRLPKCFYELGRVVTENNVSRIQEARLMQ